MSNRLELAPGDVHIWRGFLDVAPEQLAKLERPLSSSERLRARSFQRDSDQNRFTAARGWLRYLLAAYLGAKPSHLAFTPDRAGKLRLTRPDVAWLRFNLSHSAGLVLFVVASEREVGVDVEQVRRDFPVEEVASRIFSGLERAVMLSAPPGERADAFFRLWTRKEAYLKGLGTGWAASDAEIETPSHVFEPELIGGPEQRWSGGGEWTLTPVDAGVGYAATVAVEGRGAKVPRAAAPIRLKLA